jgi:hypothetical protein
MMSKADVLAQMMRDEQMMVSRLALFDAEMAAVSVTDIWGQVYDRTRTETALRQIREAIHLVKAS